MSELLPCPFCGEPEPNAEAYTNEYWVRCPKCDATCATCYDELSARDKWNTRSPARGAEVTVTDEMIQRARLAGADAMGWPYPEVIHSDVIRAMLFAALTPPAGESSDGRGGR